MNSESLVEKHKKACAMREELIAALQICENMISGLEIDLSFAVLAEATDRQNPNHFYQTNTTLKGVAE